MGQNSSKGKEQAVSDLERRLVAAVIARQKTGDGKVPPSFDAIALKFPTIRRAFRQLRNVFDKFDADRTNTIDLQEMKNCFMELHFPVHEEEIEIYFRESDMDHSGQVDFREFLVIIALTYLLNPPGPPMLSSELQKALDSVVNAFIFCDKDGSGYVSKQEIIDAFSESSLKKKSAGSSIIGPRWLEMDWDANGSVSFKEFLFAFADWVGADEDEDGT